MKVENVQAITLGSKERKSAKTNGQTGGFFQIYADSIHTVRQTKQKTEDVNTKLTPTLTVNEKRSSDLLDDMDHTNDVTVEGDILETTVEKPNFFGTRILPIDQEQGKNTLITKRIFPSKMHEGYRTFDEDTIVLPQERIRNFSGKGMPIPQISQMIDVITSDGEKLVTNSKDTILSKENFEKIKDSIALLLNKDMIVGTSEVQLSLEPVELNSVNIHLTMEDGQREVIILVGNEHAKQLIHDQVKELGEQLQLNNNKVVVKIDNKAGHTLLEGGVLQASQNKEIGTLPSEIFGNPAQQDMDVVGYQEKKILPSGGSIIEDNESLIKNLESKNVAAIVDKEQVQILSKQTPMVGDKKTQTLHEGDTLEGYEKVKVFENQIKPDVEFTENRVATDKDTLIHKTVNNAKIEKVSEKNPTAIEIPSVNYNVREFTIKDLNPNISIQETMLPEENLQRLNESIIKLIETTTQGDANVMKVKLYPKELGNVEVMLKLEDGKLVAKILVDNEQIKQLFTNKMNELSDNLLKQNISIDKLQIDVNSNSSFTGNSNGNKNGYLKKNNRQSLFDNDSSDSIQSKVENERPNAVSVLA